MAQDEISSLLLKVAVDFQSLEQFVQTMPEVVSVAEAVGQQLDALPIGNPDIFRAKGAALSRALVAGFQAEALGLTFKGGTIATLITERVFGSLDQGGAAKYVADVQRVLDGVKLALPQVTQPLISAQSLGSISNVQSFASGAKNELLALNQQLDKTLTQLSVLAQVPVPKTVIQKSPEGGLAFTPGATKAIAAASAANGFPAGVTQAFGQPVLKGDGSVNVTQTNAQVQQAITAALQVAKGAVTVSKLDTQDTLQNLAKVIQVTGLPVNPVALGAVGSGAIPPPQGIQALNLPISGPPSGVAPGTFGGVVADYTSSTTALSKAAQRAADAIEKSASSVQSTINQLAAQSQVQATTAVLASSALRDAVDNYQGGNTKAPQQAFDRLMRGEDIAGTYGGADARLLLDGINASAPYSGATELTRGLKDSGYGAVPDYASRILAEAKTYGELQLAFSGFSSDRNISSNFAQGGQNPLRLDLVGGAKALDFNRINPGSGFSNEQEFLTSGKFAVESISRGPLNPNHPIGFYNPEADIIRIRQLSTEYDALEQRLARPAPKTEAFDAFRNAQIGQPLALGPGVGNGPASAVDPQRFATRIAAIEAKVQRLVDKAISKQVGGGTYDPFPSKFGPFGILELDQNRIKAQGTSPFPGQLGSAENPRVLGPVPLPNPAGGIPGAPQLTRGTQAVVEQRQELVRLGQAADNARRQVGSALQVGARGAGGGGRRPGTGLDFTFADDFFGFRGGAGAGGGGRGFGGGGGAGGGFGGGAGASGAGASGAGGGGGFGFPPPGPLGGAGGGRGGGGGAGGIGGGLGSFFGGARRGFLGNGEDTPDFLGASIGSALRFSLVYGAAYGALRLFTGAFSTGVQEALAFEQALTDLNIATEKTGRSNERLAFQLSDEAASRGFSGAEGVAAGARAVGLFDAVDVGEEQQRAIIAASTKTAQQIAFISGQPLEQVQTQIAGITRSFEIDALDQERVADVASFLGRRTGRPGGEILQSLGQIGSLGESAGFGLEEVGAIIARLTSTTGQTPQAVSGFLSQVLSKADDPNVKRTLRGLGIDTSGTLADQIDQLADADLSRGQRNQVIQAFGRGRSGQALGIILDQKDEIDTLAEGAKNDSAGLAQKDFEQASNTVGSQLRILGTELRDLASGLASTGVLDFLVLLLSAVGAVVDVLDFLVDGFNLIPREVRSVVASLAVLAGSIALLGRFGPLSGALTGVAGRSVGNGFLGGLAGAGVGAVRGFGSGLAGAAATAGGLGTLGGLAAAARTGVAGLTAPFVTRSATVFGVSSLSGAAGSAAAGPLVGGGVGGGGALLASSAAGGITGLTALGLAATGAAAAVVALGIASEFTEASQVQRAIDEAGVAANSAVTTADFDDADRAAKDALAKAREREDFKLLSSDSFTLGLGNIFDDLRGAITGGGSKQQVIDAEAIQKRLDEDRKKADQLSQADTASVFGGFEGPDQITQALQELTEKGIPAAERIQLLNQAFDGLILKADASRDAVGVIFQGQTDVFSRAIAGSTVQGAEAFLTQQQASANSLDPLRGNDGTFTSLLRGTRGAILSNPLTGPGLVPLQALAGALGGFAGGDGFLGSIKGGFTGGADAASNAVKEFIPFATSDSERAEQQDEAAKRLRSKLGDEDVQDKLRTGVLDSLQELGKDPVLGPVTLTERDKKVIADKQLEILKKELGKDFDKLTQEEKDAFAASVTDSVGQAVGDFNGVEINAANAAAFLGATRADAGRAGADLTLTSGSAVQGTQETQRILSEARDRIQTQIATADAEIAGLPAGDERDAAVADRDALANLLKQLGLDILAAEQAATQALIGRAQAFGELAKSGLLQGDVLGANAIDAGTIREQLALPGLSEEQRAGLQAQQANLAKKDAQDRLAASGANALNALPVRATQARTLQEIGNAQARLDTLAPGSLEAEQTIAEIARLQDSIATYALDYAQAVGQLGLNPNNSAAAGRAALQDANARLTDAQATGDPLAIARAQRAQELAQFAVNVTDPIALANSQNLLNSNGGQSDEGIAALVNAQNDLLALDAGSAEYNAKQREINDLKRKVADNEQSRQNAALLESVTPGNSLEAAVAAARISARAARTAEGRFGVGSVEAREARARENQDAFAVRTGRVQRGQAQRRAGVRPEDSLGNARADVADASENLALTEKGSREYFEALAVLRRAQRSLADTVRAGAQSARRAGINPGNEIANARADVADAQEDLASFAKGSKEYNDALVRLRQSQKALADQLREAGNRQRRLGTDLTDPVAQAQQDVKDAQAALAAAKAEGGDTTQEQLDVRNAQNNAEAQAFQQRFNDARTADELGRISHAQYLDYLNNEHDRLSAITNRTRQQQEQLDQVDQAIKAANESLSGQFNLGDIDVPSPFEVRRSVAAAAGGGAVGSLTTQQNVNTRTDVTINGADLVEVKALLVSLLGAASTQRTTPTPGRKI